MVAGRGRLRGAGGAVRRPATALRPVLSELAGLPGVPVRVEQTATDGLLASAGAAISGTPPVFHLPISTTPGSFGETSSGFSAHMRTIFVTTVVAGSGVFAGTSGDPAQAAVEIALLKATGVRQGRPPGLPPPGTDAARHLAQIAAAAQRFGALPATARHAWLAAHLPALRAGHISLAQLP
jgi:hypothetical protein